MFLPAKVYYCVRADFFHHNHLHTLKVDALRNAGVDVQMIAFVSREDVAAHGSHYSRAVADYQTMVKVLPGRIGYDRRSNWLIRIFFLLRLLLRKNIIVHAHLFDFSPLYIFRKNPLLGRRLSVIVEYEGDIPSETLYRETVDSNDGPQECPPPELQETYKQQIKHQALEISNADTVMVVSDAHLELLEIRHSKKIDHIIFPTTFDNSYRFSESERERIRREHQIKDSDLVLVHLGGAVNSWHRFRETCKFIKNLAGCISGLKFFALVRAEDHQYARSVVSTYEITNITKLFFVEPKCVSAYLSACDIGLIMRHNHAMTRIVSTSKLGQYIACGLSVITTGAHAVYNEFIEKNKLSIRINSNLSLTEDFTQVICSHRSLTHNIKVRQSRSDLAIEVFVKRNDQFKRYIETIARMLSSNST